MIEAAILGKPVLSLMTPDFAGTQEGTLHFRYLLPENGGFLRVASTLEEHAGQLAEVLRDPEVTRAQTLALRASISCGRTGSSSLHADSRSRRSSARRPQGPRRAGARASR